MCGMETARLLIDPPRGGPANMARDDALLQGCAPHSPVTLRLYSWQPATISLGYFQDFEEYKRLDSPAGDLPVVRRTTGGGAILHDLELTYSIVIPIRHPTVHSRPNDLYTLMHQAVIRAIGHGARPAGKGNESCGASSQHGPFFCFARRHPLDVVVDDPDGIDGDSKIAGSAQRRTATGILQHGSIIIGSRFAQHPVATWKSLGGPDNPTDAGQALIPHISAALGLTFENDEWTSQELSAAATIEKIYAGNRWTQERERI
jgi:lipoate-protein ligase A